MVKTPLPSSREKTQENDFEELKRRIHGKLVDKLDLTRVGDLEGDVLRREIRMVVEHLCDTEDTLSTAPSANGWSTRCWTKRSAWVRSNCC